MNPGCGCEIAWFPTEAEAREAWNTRAPSPGITEGERQRVGEIAEAIEKAHATVYAIQNGWNHKGVVSELRAIAKDEGEVG